VRHGPWIEPPCADIAEGMAAAPARAAPSKGMVSAPPLMSPTDKPFSAVAGPRRRITGY